MLKLRTAATSVDIEQIQMSDSTMFWRTHNPTLYEVGEEVEVSTSDGEVVGGYVAAINSDSVDVSFS